MISFPWSLVLTAAFTFTGLVCLIHIANHWSKIRSRTSPDIGAFRMDLIVHANHLVMSIGMIAMIWTHTGTLASWAQIIFFTIVALVMMVGMARAQESVTRVSVVSHIILNAAMVWMLAAMPLLMAPQASNGEHGEGNTGGGNPSSGHSGGHSMTQTMPAGQTSDWVATTNWIAIALSSLVALWWLVMLIRSRRVGVHTLCHAVMGLGMAGMLTLM